MQTISCHGSKKGESSVQCVFPRKAIGDQNVLKKKQEDNSIFYKNVYGTYTQQNVPKINENGKKKLVNGYRHISNFLSIH